VATNPECSYGLRKVVVCGYVETIQKGQFRVDINFALKTLKDRAILKMAIEVKNIATWS
jgi:hypothetical protein